LFEAQLGGGLGLFAWLGVVSVGGDEALDAEGDLRVLGGLEVGFQLGLGGDAEVAEAQGGGLAVVPFGVAVLGDEDVVFGEAGGGLGCGYGGRRGRRRGCGRGSGCGFGRGLRGGGGGELGEGGDVPAVGLVLVERQVVEGELVGVGDEVLIGARAGGELEGELVIGLGVVEEEALAAGFLDDE